MKTIVRSAAVFIITIMAASIANAYTLPSPVSAWTFNGTYTNLNATIVLTNNGTTNKTAMDSYPYLGAGHNFTRAEKDSLYYSGTEFNYRNNDNYAVEFWVNISSVDNYAAFIGRGNGVSVARTNFIVQISATSKVLFCTDAACAGGAYMQGATTLTTGLHHIVVMHRGTNDTSSIYLDGVWDGGATTTDTGTTDASSSLTIGALNGSTGALSLSNHLNGTIYYVAIYDQYLSHANVTGLYAAKEEYGYENASGSVITLTGPTNNTFTANTSVIFTYNLSLGSSSWSYCNVTTNKTETAATNRTTNGTFTETISITTDGNRTFNASCFDSLGFSTTTSNYALFRDTVTPTITINSNSSIYSNYSLRNGYTTLDDEINLSVTFADNNALFGYLVNITRTDNGSTMYSNLTTAISYPTTSVNYNYRVNTTAWKNGTYLINLTVADGHTARAINNYQVTSKKSSINFKTDSDNNIKIETREPSEITAIKQTDRYSFAVSFDNSSTKTRTFDVKTDKCPLSYINNSVYKAHFVSSCGLKSGGNWIDFEGVGGAATIEKFDDYHYGVTIANVPGVAAFNSIGSLNEHSTLIYYYRANLSNTAPASPPKGSTGTFSLNLTNNGYQVRTVYLTINTTTTTLNASAHTCGGVLNCQETLSYDYNYTFLEGALYNYSYLINETQNLTNYSSTLTINGTVTAVNWTITKCGAAPYTFPVINFSLYLEDYPTTSTTGTMEIYGDYYSGVATPIVLNETFDANSWFALCINPNATLQISLYAIHNTTGGYYHRYYIQNGTFTNGTTTDYKIYNSNTTTGRSTLRVTARQKDTYSYYTDILGVLQRFYVGEGVWRTVQMDRSGDYGLLIYDIKEQTTDYRVAYYDANNSLLLTTQSVKFSCSSGICDVTQSLDPASSAATSQTLSASTTYDNVTKIITTTWTSANPSGETVRFLVTHETMTGQSVACNSTQNGVGGTFTCNVTAYNSNFFVEFSTASGIIINDLVHKTRSKIADYLSLGDQAVYGFGVMVTIIAAGLYSPIGAMIAGFIGLFVLSITGLVAPLTVTMLIVGAAVTVIIALRLKT